MRRPLKVAMIAPPWLKVPPHGYGGIEAVIESIVPELIKQGCEVTLFTVGTTKLPGVDIRYFYAEEQYHNLHKNLYDVASIPMTHMLFALNEIKKDGDFDIIHNHNGYVGEAITGFLDGRHFPPIVHTIHGPFINHDNSEFDYRSMYAQLGFSRRNFYVGISNAQLAHAPHSIAGQVLGTVYNAVNIEDWPVQTTKQDYFVTLARFTRDKGQDIAIRAARNLGAHLKMSGVVAGLTDQRQVMLELANPLSSYRNMADFKYFSDQIFPHLAPGSIEFLGNASGQDKINLLGNAKALLFPIRWEEPFGVAVIEALASGTPVVAMRHGAMPEIIRHGVNGFLANNEEEFEHYMKLVDTIDPAACRESVERKFTAPIAAEQYLDIYHTAIKRSRGRHTATALADRPGLLQAMAFGESLLED